MEIAVTIPLDSDGFIRRECPACEQQFKWHSGPANEEAEDVQPPDAYYCPFCGVPAPLGSWWTKEQLDYARGVAMPEVERFAQDEIGKALRGLKSLGFTTTTHGGSSDEPVPLTEPTDMEIVCSPCHAYEPIKVPLDAASEWHCLVCGSRFAV